MLVFGILLIPQVLSLLTRTRSKVRPWLQLPTAEIIKTAFGDGNKADIVVWDYRRNQ
jgi:hypothetical protein